MKISIEIYLLQTEPIAFDIKQLFTKSLFDANSSLYFFITFSSTIIALFEDCFLFRLQKYNKMFKISRLAYLNFAKMHIFILQTLLKCIFCSSNFAKMQILHERNVLYVKTKMRLRWNKKNQII